MKYIKKLSIGLVIAVLSSGIFIGLVPSRAYAAPGDPIALKRQYVIYKSADLLKRCIEIKTDYKATNAQDVINSIFYTGYSADLEIGKLYGKFLGNEDIGNFDCNTPKTINSALKALDYGSIYDFANEMGFPDKKLTKKDLDKKINEKVKDKGVPNNLYDTRPFRYWYYNTVFRATLADGGCKGTFSDEQSATAKTNLPGNFYNVGTDGVVKEYKFAIYDVETGSNLPDLDDEVLRITGLGTKEITCRRIALEITKERAEAYAAFLTTPEGSAEKGANTAGASGTGSDSIGSGVDAEDEINVQCSVNLLNPLSYFMCPLITGFIKAMNTLDQAITDQLTVDTANYIQGREADSFKIVWTNMRNLAISFIVIVGLLMVIGTAVEVGPFDPYTVKKVMPRLLVAVIVISLSWPLVIFLIDASNSLGLTIKGLIQQPFTELLTKPIQIGGGQQWVAVAGTAGAGVALGIVGLLSFVATAFLGVALAFLVLVLRQILVILLAVIAPIAIAMLILPNTQKVGKAWWDLFARSLLVFPIIAAFIATGRVFAAITVANADGNLGTFGGFIAFFAYFGPYFALPFAFKLAGGAVGQISGFVNNKSRGGYDRLKKFRQGQTQKNAQKSMGGERFKNTGILRGLNTPLQGAAFVASGKAGVNPKDLRSKLSSAQANNALRQGTELLDKNEAFRAIASDDTMLQAAMTAGSASEIERQLTDSGRYRPDQLAGAVASVQAAQNSGSRDAVRIAANQGIARNGQAWATHADMLDSIANASDDVAVRNALLGQARSASTQVGRPDLGAPGHTALYDTMQALEAGRRGEAGGISRADANTAMSDAAWAQGGPGAMLAMKEHPFEDMTTRLATTYREQRTNHRALAQQAEAASAAGNQTEANRLTTEANQASERALTSAAQMVSLRNSSGQASSANRQSVVRMLDSVGIDTNSEKFSIDAQLATQLVQSTGLENSTGDPGSLIAEIRNRAGSFESISQAQGSQNQQQGSQTNTTPEAQIHSS